MKKANKTKIKRSIIEQLQQRGANIEALSNLVEDYLFFCDLKEQLKADIVTRGVTYPDLNSKGVEVQKENPSTKSLIMLNKQMLAILDKLDIKPSTIVEPDGEDSDL